MPNGRSRLTSCPRSRSSLYTASGNRRLDVEFVEARTVRPERAVEVQRLHARALERAVQVRIPVVPELDDAQERLEDRLLLIVAARRADAHHRHVALEDDARCQRVARAGAGAELVRPRLVEPELLAADAHADAGVAEDDGAVDPAAARRHIEDVAVLVDHRDVRRVLHDAGGIQSERRHPREFGRSAFRSCRP